MLMKIPMYNVTFQVGNEVIIFRVPADEVSRFVNILLLNGVTRVSMEVEDG